MSDAEPASRTDQLGVVDPLRIPGLATARRFWSGLPLLGRAFIVAALVDIVARALGLFGLPSPIDLASPLSIIGFLPHLAYVLFPLVVLWRRPDAATDTPSILWGAVALALYELLSLPLTSLVATTDGDLTARTVVNVVAVATRTAGYIALAMGLRALTRSAPSQAIVGLSNLTLGVIAASVLVGTLFVFLQPAPDVGDPSWSAQVQLMNAIGSLPLLAFAFLARVIVRGTVDMRRPIVATYVGTGAVLLTAVVHVTTLAIGMLALVQVGFALSNGSLGAASGIAFGLLGIAANILLVVAFGLGLGDTSVRMPTSTSEESKA